MVLPAVPVLLRSIDDCTHALLQEHSSIGSSKLMRQRLRWVLRTVSEIKCCPEAAAVTMVAGSGGHEPHGAAFAVGPAREYPADAAAVAATAPEAAVLPSAECTRVDAETDAAYPHADLSYEVPREVFAALWERRLEWIQARLIIPAQLPREGAPFSSRATSA